jgi:hypothetical protein
MIALDAQIKLSVSMMNVEHLISFSVLFDGCINLS